MHLTVQTGCVRSLSKWIRPCVTLVKATKATIYQVRPYNNLLESFFSEVQGALTFTCLARVCGQSKFLTMIITQWKKSSKMLALLATNRILFRLIPNSLALAHPVSNSSIFYISRSNSSAPNAEFQLHSGISDWRVAPRVRDQSAWNGNWNDLLCVFCII